MNATPDALPYRPCAGVVLLNASGEVFVGTRIDAPQQYWQMPQGGVDDGESPTEAALRELEEETGVSRDQVEVLAEHPEWLLYDLPEHLIGKVWKGKYRGQTQKWVLMRFLGTDDDVNINTEHPEFSTWRWVPMDQLVALVIPFKATVYEQVVQAFRPYL